MSNSSQDLCTEKDCKNQIHLEAIASTHLQKNADNPCKEAYCSSSRCLYHQFLPNKEKMRRNRPYPYSCTLLNESIHLLMLKRSVRKDMLEEMRILKERRLNRHVSKVPFSTLPEIQTQAPLLTYVNEVSKHPIFQMIEQINVYIKCHILQLTKKLPILCKAGKTIVGMNEDRPYNKPFIIKLRLKVVISNIKRFIKKYFFNKNMEK